MPRHKNAHMTRPPLQRTLVRLSLAGLLLLPAHLPAQTPPPPEPDAAAARATCAADLAAGRYAQALPACQAVLRNAEKLLGPEDESVGYWLLVVGRALAGAGKHAEAVPQVQRALRIFQKVHGDQHPDVAASMNSLAGLYQAQGQYAQAEPLYQRSLGIVEKALGPGHPDVATSLNNLAALYKAQGQYAQAEPLYQRSLGISEKALGLGHPDVAVSLNNLAALYETQGQYAQAERLFKRSLDIYEKALGPGHPDVAASLNNIAALYQAQGQYAQAAPLYKRSLELWEKALGPGHPQVATSLNNLAGLYVAQGQYARAESLYQRSLAIREKALGPGHRDVATSLNNLALLYQAQGQYAQAKPLFMHSLAIREKALGAGHPDVAASLNNLAMLYQVQGQSTQGLPRYLRNLGTLEKLLGLHHPQVLSSLRNLAQLHLQGDSPSQALPHLSALLDRSLWRDGLYMGDSLWAIEQLGRLRAHLNQSGEVTALVERLGTLLVAAPVPEPGLAEDAAERLARVLEWGLFQMWLRRDYARAERLVAQVRGLAVAKGGPTAAALRRLQGVLARASPELRRLLALHAWLAKEKADEHARRLFAAAVAEVAAGRVEEAGLLLMEGLYLSEQHLRDKLSEQALRVWLEVQRPSLELCFELSRRYPGSASLRQLAWTASLLSKARALDAEVNKLRLLRSPEIAQKHGPLLERRNALSAEKNWAVMHGQGGLMLVDVQERFMQVEDLLLRSLGEGEVEALPEPWEILRRVTAALKADEALVDYVEYVAPPLGDQGGGGTRRYLALVLRPGRSEAERTQVVDVGEVAAHQSSIERLLRDLRSPASQPQAAAKEVYQRLLAPVRKAAGAVARLHVVPDGALSLIPFDALVDERGKYVIDGTMEIRYQASGRDLLREYGAASGRPPLVLGDPDLRAAPRATPPPVAKGPTAGGKTTRADAGRAASLYASAAALEPLSHARAEAEALGQKLVVKPLVGAAASEPRLRQETKAGIGPRILHLAMHGLFPDEALGPLGRGARSRIVPVDESRLSPPAPPPAAASGPVGMAAGVASGESLDPMLHSALVLAGAARAQAQGDSTADGVLTADEARTLSLEGTELTVLSACQTALGSLRAGNGVDGLRRAFLIAGSEAVVASLWRVSDPGTRTLMTLYYERLIDHQSRRITAMREAMQAMKRDRPHPYYWAPFVAIGRDAPLRPLGHVLPQTQAGK